MKTLITALCTIASIFANAQINESFTNGVPAGWTLAQGMSLISYKNPVTSCSDDNGASTTNIGQQGTSYIVTPEIPYTSGMNVRVNFRIYVFDANLKCNSTKLFPCASYVKIYMVRNNYDGAQPPSAADIIAESTLQLMQDNDLNSLLIQSAALNIPNGTLYRIYVDYNTPIPCAQTNTRYVMDNIQVLEQQQSTLPVRFSSFTATRKSQQVYLNWETSTEIDNRGFNVQSKTGNSEWKDLAFVASKADGGNSSSTLSYNFTDVNISEGILQYRLQQIDQDGKFEYSEIRTVKSEKLSIPVLLYPNPATGGLFNIALDDASASYEISVSDGSGKTIKSYNNFSGARLTVDGLNKGFYLVTITDMATKLTFTQKLIVKD